MIKLTDILKEISENVSNNYTLLLRDLYSRIDKDGFFKYTYDMHSDGDENNKDNIVVTKRLSSGEFDSEEFVYNFLEYLNDELYLRIIDEKYIEIYELTDYIEHVIGDNWIQIYHYAPEKYIEDIKDEGLIPNKIKTNPYKNSYSGIYLTTTPKGIECDGYIMRIRDTHDCEAVLLTLKMKLSEIEPDPDDIDISCGSNQFVTGYVSPDRILGIENV